jgi:hypothetical protein
MSGMLPGMLLHHVELPWEMPKNAVLQMVGAMPVVLHNSYDPDQLWLPFVQAMVVYIKPDKAKPSKKHSEVKLRKQAARDFATISDEARVLHYPERDVPQLPLPYPGWRRITKAPWRREANAGHPAWDRTNEGKLLSFAIRPLQYPEIDEYCEMNFRGRYAIRKDRLYVERQEDHVLARIAYAVGD